LRSWKRCGGYANSGGDENRDAGELHFDGMVVLDELDGKGVFEVVALRSLLVVMISKSRDWGAGWCFIYLLIQRYGRELERPYALRQVLR
jgi:hypothetical protein